MAVDAGWEAATVRRQARCMSGDGPSRPIQRSPDSALVLQVVVFRYDPATSGRRTRVGDRGLRDSSASRRGNGYERLRSSVHLPHARTLQAGFTLVELVIAALVVALVMSAVLASASLAQATYRVHAEAADMDQRTRVLVHALQHDLTLAGAGLDQGPLAGALTQSFAPILPRAIGTDGPEAATASAITIRYVPPARRKRRSLTILPAARARSESQPMESVRPRTPSADFQRACRWRCSTGAVRTILLTIADVQDDALRFRAPTEGAILPLAAGAAITQVVVTVRTT